MSRYFKNIKIVYDPLWGLVNITDHLPMIDVPQFQALGFKCQLGVTSILFPSATHTRKQHSFGAFRRTQDLADRWLHRGFITKNEARLIIAYALWHDIGHGPFSHVVEEITEELWGRNHDENGAIIVEALQAAVEAVGLDFAEFKKLFTRENPLYLAVHDKNLGTEKLDYLSRDAYYTIGESPGVEYLAHHTYFVDGNLVIDEKAIDQAKSIQEFYAKMFKTVYLRKNSVIAQRLVQKMTLELIRSENLGEEAFWALTDFGLLGRFETARSPVIRDYHRRFMCRDLPRTAIALRPERFAPMEGSQRKAQRTLGVSDEAMTALSSLPDVTKPSALERLEEQIARIANLPERSVLVVPPTAIARFQPQDIRIFTESRKPASLRDYFSGHFDALAEAGQAYAVTRICTFEEHREALSEPRTAESVRDYLLSCVYKTV